MSVTFKIVEGTTDTGAYEDFIDCYNKVYTTKEIIAILGISKSTQNSFYKQAKQEGLLKLKRRDAPKYYFYSTFHNRWIVQKRNKDIPLVKIFCNSEKEAQAIVERLKKHNWDQSEVKKIRKTLRSGGVIV